MSLKVLTENSPTKNYKIINICCMQNMKKTIKFKDNFQTGIKSSYRIYRISHSIVMIRFHIF